MLRSQLFLLLALLCAYPSFSQKRDERQYRERAAEVRNEIWGVKNSAFELKAAPAGYEKESAVILAKQIQYELTGKMSRMGLMSAVRAHFYILTFRQRVQINDKAALEEFSELSFQKSTKRAALAKKAGSKVYVGVKILKPGGQERELDVQAEAIDIKSDSDDKQQKVAISDLQIGDVIEYYIRVEDVQDYYVPIEPFSMTLADDYPVVHFEFEARIEDEFEVRMASMNGAPKLVPKRKDGYIQLAFEQKNLPKEPEDIWVHNQSALPTIKFYLRGITPGMFGTIKKGEVLPPLKASDIEERFSWGVNQNSPAMSELRKKVRSVMREREKELKKKDKELSTRQIVEMIYYLGRYYMLYQEDEAAEGIVVDQRRNNWSAKDEWYADFVGGMLETYDIPFDFVIMLPRASGSIKNSIDMNELYRMIRVRDGKNTYYFYPPNMFSHLGSIPFAFEGSEGYVIDLKAKGDKKITPFKVPAGTPTDNLSREDIQVQFDANDPQLLRVQRQRLCTGFHKLDYQERLLLFEEYGDAERKRLGIEGSFLDDIRKFPKGAKLVEEYKQAFVKAREKQKEFFESEIENSIDVKPKEMTAYKVVKSGLDPADPAFVYSSDFALEGLVRKAGPNYIVEAGKLIGGQIEIKAEQRTRKYDIYGTYPRIFEYQIEIAIPAGYKAEGLQDFTKNVSNATGSFVSSAAQEGNKVVIKSTKTYLHNFEPAANWNDMLAFLDAANDFTQQKLLLKKM